MKNNQLSEKWEKTLLNEKCKTCHKEVKSGIWMASQFADEKVLLFCSEKCKIKYIKRKLGRIKTEYPKYYEKIIKSLNIKNLQIFVA